MSKAIKSNEPKKSNTPLLIIAGVVVLGALGAWYMYNSSKTTPGSNTNRAAANSTNSAKPPAVPNNAPAGATPPNQAGSPTAAVTVEEFADFQCGSCAAAHPVLNEIKSLYGSRIRFVFRNFPLKIPAHDKAYDAAVAAEAAGMQGKFWDLQNLLFVNQQAWTNSPAYRETWKGYAARIGLDVPKWENDMAGIATKTRVDADIARGRAMNVGSTPSIYINNAPVPFNEMNVTGLKALIDAELQKSSAPTQTSAPATTAPANTNATK